MNKFDRLNIRYRINIITGILLGIAAAILGIYLMMSGSAWGRFLAVAVWIFGCVGVNRLIFARTDPEEVAEALNEQNNLGWPRVKAQPREILSTISEEMKGDWLRLGAAFIIGAISILAWQQANGPSSVEECYLEEAKKVTTEFGAQMVARACQDRFAQSDE